MGSYKDVTWKKFGRLLVLADVSKHPLKHGRPYRVLFCKCDCGKECLKRKEKVLNGSVRSCGCLQRETFERLLGRRKLGNGEASANERYGAYKRAAHLRGLTFELTKEQFMDIVSKPCIYCGVDKSQIYRKNNPHRNGMFKYTGIDRYDNTKGYTVENCVPCCTKCNRMKLDMTPDEMLAQMKKIIANEKRWHRTA